MHGLIIDLQSIKLNSDILQRFDRVRVSITTFPEKNKESVVINPKNMNYIHHFFKINITDQTQKIKFVFRRKSFINNDPIIAIGYIESKKLPLPKNEKNTEIKTIYLFERSANGTNSKKILGEMQIQLTLTTEFPILSCQNTNFLDKIFSKELYSKDDDISKNNNSIFLGALHN